MNQITESSSRKKKYIQILLTFEQTNELDNQFPSLMYKGRLIQKEVELSAKKEWCISNDSQKFTNP